MDEVPAQQSVPQSQESFQGRVARVFNNFKSNRKVFIPTVIGGSLLILGVIGVLGYEFIYLPIFQNSHPPTLSFLDGSPKPQPKDVPGPINGVLFTANDAKAWQSRTPLAVIVENSLDARPESGLSSADLVYEALAEGGITRQLALFQTNPAAVYLGPIRSMRVYFLDWLEEYNAIAVHVGGNFHALDRIGPEGVRNLDGIYLGSPTFTRTSDRLAPHNDYTGTDKLWALADKNGLNAAPSYHSWPFKSDATPSARPTAQTINLGFLGDLNYVVKWVYDAKSNLYSKFDGGVAFVDRNNNQQITAKTVVVQVVPYTLFPDHGALNMQDIGSGAAFIFEDGVVQKGTWVKNSRTDRTLFKDASGKEIPFNRGPIWIDVIPPATPFTY